MSTHGAITLADALAECRRIRMDLTNAQAKLTDVINALAAHPDADRERPRCHHCDLSFRGPLSLAEHLHLRHGEELPAHQAAADIAAGLPDPRA